MATSIGELLDMINGQAGDAIPQARAATLARLGRTLAALRVDGLTETVDSPREDHVSALAVACLALRPPDDATGGRLADLAAVAGDAVTTSRQSLTRDSRWALAVAYADTASALAISDQFDPPSRPAEHESLRLVRNAARHVARDAAIDPPTGVASVVLDQPIPGREHAQPLWAEGVLDAVASLLQATRPEVAPLTVGQALAVTFAAERLTVLAAELTAFANPAAEVQPDAGAAWRAVRSELQPFTDGTRRPQSYLPPVVQAAALVHSTAGMGFHAGALPARQKSEIAAAVQHLPELAEHLSRTVQRWGATGTLLANSRDLPPRSDRTDFHLHRYRQGGVVQMSHLVRADGVDLAQVQAALRDVRTLAVASAAEVDRAVPRKPAMSSPRVSAVHRAEQARPASTAAVDAARHNTSVRLRAVPSNAPRSSRRV